VQRLDRSIGKAVLDIEGTRLSRLPVESLNAEDLLLLVKADMANHQIGPEQNARNIQLLERALTLNPKSVEARLGLYSELLRPRTQLNGTVTPEAVARARQLVEEARRIAPGRTDVIQTQADLLAFDGRWDEARSSFRQIVREHPDWIHPRVMLGECERRLGRPEEAVPLLKQALNEQLSEHSDYPFLFITYWFLTYAYFDLGRYDDALSLLHLSKERAPVATTTDSMMLASVYGHLGRAAEARPEIAQMLQQAPFLNTVLGPSDADILLYQAKQEFEADFLGMQNMFALLRDCKLGVGFTYWGVDLFFAAVKTLYRSLGHLLADDETRLLSRLMPSIPKRETALREGLQLYFKDFDDEQVSGAVQMSILVEHIGDTLWSACKGTVNFPVSSLALVWRQVQNTALEPSLTQQEDELKVGDELFGKPVHEIVGLAMSGDVDSRVQLQQVGPAAIILLLKEASCSDIIVREAAKKQLISIDAEIQGFLPIFRYGIQRDSFCEMVRSEEMVELIEYMTRQLRKKTGFETP
jgi:tetratricopeptide (TPR) repeat protein